MDYSGYSSGSFNPPTQYESLSGSPATTENSAFTLTWQVSEFINYAPNTPSITTTFTNSGSTINAVATTSEQVTGEKENVVINWGDGTPTTALNDVSPGTQPTQSHTYTGNYYGTFTQTYNPSVTVTNLPNGNPSGNTVQTNSASTSYTFGMQVNPTTPYSIVLAGQYIWLNITTTNVALTSTSATVSLNNLPYVQATLAYTSGNTYDYKYTSSLIGTTGITANWKVDPASLVDTISVQYATKTVPTIDSPSVTALFSNSYTSSYTLNIAGAPTGTGFYQQLFTIGNSTDPISHYGINSQGSNFLISASNGSNYYTWIQSINTTAITFWSKLPYNISSVQMNVYPEFENLFSATGYLGKWNTTTDNGNMVFPLYQSWAGLSSLPSGWTAYGNVSDTIVTYHSNHITLTTTGNANSNPYVADIYHPYDFSVPASLYSNMVMYENNPSGDEQQVGFLPSADIPTQSESYGYFIFDGYGGGTGGIGTSINNIQMTPETPSRLLYEISVVNATTMSLTLNGATYTEVGTAPALPNTVSYYSNVNQTSFDIYYTFITSYVSSMPTFTVSAGSAFQSNATANNETYQHYATFAPDGYNLTQGQYTYSIPDSFNSNYVTIVFNSSWTLDEASYGHSIYTSYPYSFITFGGVSGIGTLTMTFTEPIVIGQPLGVMSLGVLPSVAIGGKTFFEMPANYLHWKMIDQGDTQTINPSGFNVVVGKPVTILGYTGADTPVYNKTLTPSSYNTFLQTYVNVSEIEIMNENMNETLHIQATSNGTTQAVADVLPFQTATIYVPGTNYTVSLNYYNFTTGQPIGNTQTVTTFGQTGLQWWIASGIMLSQIQNNINFTRTNVANEINDLKISINLNESAIKNLTTDINVNLTGTNSSIQNQITKIFTNFTNQNTLINHENLSIQNSITLTDSMIKSFNLNLSSNFTITNSLIKNSNISQYDRFEILNSSLKNVTFNQTDYFNLVNDSIHHMNLTQTQYFNIIDTTLLNSNLNQSTRFNILNSSLKNTNLSQTQHFNLLNDSIFHANLTQSQDYSLLNTSLHNVNLTQKQYFILLNDSLAGVNITQTQHFDILDSVLKDANINQSTRFTILNSALHNVSFNQSQYFTIVNDSIHNLNLSQTNYYNLMNDTMNNVNLSLQNRINFVGSKVGNMNISIMDRIAAYQSVIGSQYVNISVKQTYTDTLINTSAYQFIPQAPSVYGNKYVFPVNVVMKNSSLPANLTITKEAANNLKVMFMAAGTVNLNYKVSNLSAGFFDLSMDLSPQQVGSINNGSSVVITSPFQQGSVSNVAVGQIRAQNIPAQQQTWYEQYLGFKSAPPGGFADFGWILLSVPSLASAGVLGAVIAIYYLNKMRQDFRDGRKRKERERKEEERDRKIDEIYRSVKE